MDIRPRFMGPDAARVERLSLLAEEGVETPRGVSALADEAPHIQVWVGREPPAPSCQGWLRTENGKQDWRCCVEEARQQREAHGLLFVGMSHVQTSEALPEMHCLVDTHNRALVFANEREMEHYVLDEIASLQEAP